MASVGLRPRVSARSGATRLDTSIATDASTVVLCWAEIYYVSRLFAWLISRFARVIVLACLPTYQRVYYFVSKS